MHACFQNLLWICLYQLDRLFRACAEYWASPEFALRIAEDLRTCIAASCLSHCTWSLLCAGTTLKQHDAVLSWFGGFAIYHYQFAEELVWDILVRPLAHSFYQKVSRSMDPYKINIIYTTCESFSTSAMLLVHQVQWGHMEPWPWSQQSCGAVRRVLSIDLLLESPCWHRSLFMQAVDQTSSGQGEQGKARKTSR